MARYIDADALMEAIKRELWDWQTLDGITPTCVLKQTITDIQNAPTADVVERKKGKWLNKFVDGLGFNGLEFECSECGKRSAGRTNYCAYCGAQMKSE